MTGRAPQIVAHRGASATALENTIDAFRTAVALGADGIELDVRRTADGVLVVHHDAHIDGVAIIERPADALPEHVPTLEAALEACAGAWVNVEIKNDPRDPDFDAERRVAERVAAVLGELDRPERWLVSSFDLAMIDAVHRAAAAIPTAWLVLAVPDDAAEAVRAAGHVAIHPWVEMLQREQVEQLHRTGLRVNTWTCNDPTRIEELAAWGVDGIVTDVPDLALAAVREIR